MHQIFSLIKGYIASFNQIVISYIYYLMKQTLLIVSLLFTINCLSIHQRSLQKPTYSNMLTLQFDHAATEKVPFNSASFDVFWNDQKIASIVPRGYVVHSKSYQLVAKPGRNTLAFAGTGTSDGKGSAITNVKLLRKSSYGLQDLVENGEFKEGWNKEDRFRIFEESIPGWRGKQIEVGNGDIYNRNWPKGAVVSELDAEQNTRIEQNFYFSDEFQIFYEPSFKDLAI